MRGGVDAARQSAHHRHPRFPERFAERARLAQSKGACVARADHCNAGLLTSLDIAQGEQHERRIKNLLEQWWIFRITKRNHFHSCGFNLFFDFFKIRFFSKRDQFFVFGRRQKRLKCPGIHFPSRFGAMKKEKQPFKAVRKKPRACKREQTAFFRPYTPNWRGSPKTLCNQFTGEAIFDIICRYGEINMTKQTRLSFFLVGLRWATLIWGSLFVGLKAASVPAGSVHALLLHHNTMLLTGLFFFELVVSILQWKAPQDAMLGWTIAAADTVCGLLLVINWGASFFLLAGLIPVLESFLISDAAGIGVLVAVSVILTPFFDFGASLRRGRCKPACRAVVGWRVLCRTCDFLAFSFKQRTGMGHFAIPHQR